MIVAVISQGTCISKCYVVHVERKKSFTKIRDIILYKYSSAFSTVIIKNHILKASRYIVTKSCGGKEDGGVEEAAFQAVLWCRDQSTRFQLLS